MTDLPRPRAGLRSRALAFALPLQLAAMLLWPVVAAAIPPLPGPPVPLPPVPVPIPNPFVPDIGAQGSPVAPCSFPALGPNEVRTLFREGGDTGTSFGIDPANPCHVFRSVTPSAAVLRSDASGRAFSHTFDDRSQVGNIHGGRFRFSPVLTAATGNGPAYFYDESGNNGVVYTPDNGQTWQQKINGLYSAGTGPTGGIDAFAVAPGNAAVAYLAGNVGGQSIVYRTVNSGDNWQMTASQIGVPVTSLSVDPENPAHVVAAAGGPTTGLGRAGGGQYYDSGSGGDNWSGLAGPPGESSPIDVTVGGGQRVYARTGAQGTGDINTISGQKFWRLSPGRPWEAINVPASTGLTGEIAYNPTNPNEMIIATPAGAGIAMAGSLDGFSSTRFSKVVKTGQDVRAARLRADRHGQFFALAKGGGEDQLLALRVTALAADPPPPGPPPVNLQTALKVCNLQDLSQPGPLPGQRTTVNYKSGSIAFDGRFLDYTHDDLDPVGVVYRIDPTNCQPQAPIRPTALEFGGQPRPLFALTFDPQYTFNNGHVGAILARGGTGASHDPRVGDPNDVPIYAIDPNPSPAPMEIAATQDCGTANGPTTCDEPNLFNYDHYLDALWIFVPGDYDAPVRGLARLPSQKGQRVVPMQTCMTRWRLPDPGQDMAMWEPGADGILYVGVEDDVTVVRVNSKTCQYLDAFTHEHYSEGPKVGPSNETDQMACDAVTFGQGAPNVPTGTGTSALWIRDNALNLVRAYPIARGFCPFPTSLKLLNPPATARPGDTVTVCAVLEATTAGVPRRLSGQTVQFALGGTAIGTAVTDAEGRACITTAIPNVSGPLNLSASFAGTEAFLPAAAVKPLRVDPFPPPPVTQAGAQAVPPAHVAPPNPALVPAPPPAIPVVAPQPQAQAQAQAQTQVQTQAQGQAQAQAQGQPGLMTEKQKQARVNLARIDGGKQMADIEASRYHAALFAQGAGLGLFGVGLWVKLRRNRRRRPMMASLRGGSGKPPHPRRGSRR
ncbi:MAG: hypothetical protein NVS3B24_23740 [Candidatus Dormibacteria bacterium]